MRQSHQVIMPSFSPTEKSIFEMIYADSKMMEILAAARDLYLPDWCIGAGFVRNKIWDVLHELTDSKSGGDIDLVYFDPSDISEASEFKHQKQLFNKMTGPCWSVKNQARMHLKNGDEPYRSTADAMRFWPEVCTAVGVRLNDNDELELIAPYGVRDLFEMIIRPTPAFKEKKRELYRQRLMQKAWQIRWTKLISL